MLLPRVATALVLLALLLAAIFGLEGRSGWFYVAVCAVAVGAASEWAMLMGSKSTAARVRYVIAVALICAAAWQLRAVPHGVAVFAGVAFLWWLYAIRLVKRFPVGFDNGPWPVERMAPLGFLVIPATVLPLAALHAQADGPWRVLFMLFVVIAADVGAYLVGRNYGRHKLAPNVSPGKSVEGAVGGIVLAGLWAVCAGPLAFGVDSVRGIALLVLVSVVTAAVSVVGDLTESLFKRLRGVKDSGTLLPGHGGVLDRIDAIIAAAPTFYLGVALLGL